MSCQYPPHERAENRARDPMPLDRYMMERPALVLATLDLMEKFERHAGPTPTGESKHAS